MRGAGLILSVGLHASAAALMVVGWPYISPDPRPPIPDVPIELISEAELAEVVSVPEQTRAEEPEPAPEPEPEPEEPEPEPAPEPPAPEPEPEPAAPPSPEEEALEPEPEPTPEPEAPEPDPVPEPEPEEPADDLAGLDDVLKDLDPDKDERRKPREVAEDDAGGEADVERIGTGRTLTITEEAALKKAFVRCWQEPGVVPDRESLIVRVRVRLNRNGTLNGAPVVLNDTEINRSGNRFWQAARLNAVAAVTQCAPYDFLPDDLIADAIDEGGFDYTFRPDPA